MNNNNKMRNDLYYVYQKIFLYLIFYNKFIIYKYHILKIYYYVIL